MAEYDPERCGYHEAKRAEVVAEARRWIDTPMKHLGAGQLVKSRAAASPGIAADCFGLIFGVGLRAGAFIDPGADLDSYLYYGRLPDSARMREALDRFLVKIDEHEVGDIAFLAWGSYRLPMHLAIMAEFDGRPSMIHATGEIVPRRVREQSWGGDWPNLLHGFYRYPGLA